MRGGTHKASSANTDALIHAAILGERTKASMRIVADLRHPRAPQS